MLSEVFSSLELTHLAMLGLCLTIAFGFEVINGFHDAANAVATVIYTKSLRPTWAVVLSGLANLLGVLRGGTAVAFSIVHLLPVDLLVDIETTHGLTVVLAMLLSAVMWNLGTWYLGLPASSSHTLIGSILGVALTHGMLSGKPFGAGVNWNKAAEVGLSLLISPLLGFLLAAGLLLTARKLWKNEALSHAPVGDQPPPSWIRTLLVGSCAGVSFAHGSNDGQKGMGLIMLVLIGLLPAHFALNNDEARQCPRTLEAATAMESMIVADRTSAAINCSCSHHAPRDEPGPHHAERHGHNCDACRLRPLLGQVIADLKGKTAFTEIPLNDRWQVRTRILELNDSLASYGHAMAAQWPAEQQHRFEALRLEVRQSIDYVPWWIIVMVALCLGLGGMVGWKRVVVTVGEKIGKAHLTYGQGVSAQLVAMGTIGLADIEGLPVSTTHVLSSGVAGSATATGSGLNPATVRSILLAWILTLPAAILLSSALLIIGRLITG